MAPNGVSLHNTMHCTPNIITYNFHVKRGEYTTLAVVQIVALLAPSIMRSQLQHPGTLLPFSLATVGAIIFGINKLLHVPAPTLHCTHIHSVQSLVRGMLCQQSNTYYIRISSMAVR